jgi:DUF4097 and DUF4098 domain-containing protein YvlB
MLYYQHLKRSRISGSRPIHDFRFMFQRKSTLYSLRPDCGEKVTGGKRDHLFCGAHHVSETFPGEPGQITERKAIRDLLYTEENRMKKLSIVGILCIALLAICLGSIVAVVPAISRAFSGQFQWNLFSARNIGADAVEELKAPVDGPANLRIDTPFGKVEIAAVEGSSEILISAHKYAWGVDKAAAEGLLEKTKLVFHQDGNSVSVYVNQPVQVDLLHIGPAGISVDFTVQVPPECAVEASSSSGNVSLDGISGTANLQSSFGEVEAKNVSGKITAKTGAGNATVKGARAGEEALEASSSFGDVDVSDSEGGSLIAKSGSGKVTAEDSTFTGRADISSSFGVVAATNVKARSIDARANSGAVALHGLDIREELNAHSDFGDVEVLDASAESYTLNTDSGKVTVEGARGKIHAHSGFGGIHIRGTAAILDLSTSSGSIEFTGSLGDGTSVLHTNFGDIRVRLPADAQFRLDLSTNSGELECGFSVTATKSSRTHLVGTVGEGGPALEASTDSGRVSVQPEASE